MSTPTVASATTIRPFTVNSPEDALADLRRRIAATRWPTIELVADRSQGVQLATIQALARYWTTDYDWRKCEAKLNATPQFKTEIDGIDVHFIHVKSRHKNAMPLIMTHGWPGSVIELLETIGPLTDPTAHGARAGRQHADGHRRGTRCGRADRHLSEVRGGLLHRDGHPSGDDRLRPARLPYRSGRLDGRPRHRCLLQDRSRLRRGAALGQPHARPHPRQHHALLADQHRRHHGPVVLGGLRTRRAGRSPAAFAAADDPVRLHDLPRRDLADSAQLGRGELPERHLLPRGRQRRPLRRLGGAGAVLVRAPRRVQLTALATRRMERY